MDNIEIYTTPLCPNSHRAKALLEARGLSYKEFDVSLDTNKLTEMLKRSQRRTVPQIFIGTEHIGGSDDLAKAEQDGRLEQ